MNSSLDILDEIINKIDYKPFGGLTLTKSSGSGTYSWLKWITIIFEKPIKSYIGVQIYPYYIERKEIGIVLEENDINTHDFPFDFRKRFRISDNMAIDMETGNIMKKCNKINELQIWMCQHIKDWEKYGDHKCILKNGYKDNEHLMNFYNKYKKTQQSGHDVREYGDIIHYYDYLFKSNLVSNKIDIRNKSIKDICGEVSIEIKRMVNDKMIKTNK